MSVARREPALQRALVLIEPIKETQSALLDAICSYDRFLCSDPRDKIFALLGFTASIEATVEKIPDDQPTTLMFRDFAEHFIRLDLLPEVLNHVHVFGPAHSEENPIPAWVPNWSSLRGQADSDILDSRKGWLRLVGPSWRSSGSNARRFMAPRKKCIAVLSQGRQQVHTIQPAIAVAQCTELSAITRTWLDVITSFRILLLSQGLSLARPGVIAPFIVSQTDRLSRGEPDHLQRPDKILELAYALDVLDGKLPKNLDRYSDCTDLLVSWREITRQRHLFCSTC